MSYEQDPPPLADAGSDAPESLRALLRSARTDVPTSIELAGLKAKLGPLLSGSGAPTAAPGLSTLGKAGLAVLGGLVVAAGLYFVSSPAPKAPDLVNVPEPLPVEPRAEPAKDRGALPTTAPDTVPSTGVEPAKPSPEAAPAPRAQDGASRPNAVPEDQLLENARRALGSDPNRALAMTREHARSYPKGVLSQEREVIAIEALKRLGRTQEADARRLGFEQRYPQSAHRRNLEGLGKTDGGGK